MSHCQSSGQPDQDAKIEHAHWSDIIVTAEGLTNASHVRLKSYSAETGYVYEYFFRVSEGGVYRFEVSWDRQNFHAVFVEINRQLLEATAGRGLSEVEEFAIAKMSLFQMLDERAEPCQLGVPFAPDGATFLRILTRLDLL